jgi:hypothetical protein
MIQLENSPIIASIDETTVFSGGGVFAMVMLVLTQTIGLFALLGSTNIFQQLMAGVMIISGTLLWGIGVIIGRKRSYVVRREISPG